MRLLVAILLALVSAVASLGPLNLGRLHHAVVTGRVVCPPRHGPGVDYTEAVLTVSLERDVGDGFESVA